MRIVIKILILFLILIQSFSEVLGQSMPKACGGALERYKTVGSYQSVFIWTIEGGAYVQLPNRSDTVAKTDTSVIEVTWDKNVGYHSITVTEQLNTPFGACFGPTLLDSVAIESPVLEIAEKNMEICSDGTFTFHATPSYNYYVWDSINSNNNTYTINSGGMHRVSSSIVIDPWPGDTTRCVLSDSTYLTINIKPVVDLGNDTVLCANDRLMLTAGVSDSLYNYDWSTGDIAESIEIGAGGREYWVKVSSQKGCITYDTINVLACTRSMLLGDIPNTFTPNGDLENDEWNVPMLVNFPDAKVEIYDRWGRMVWNSEKAIHKTDKVGWDGNDLKGNKLPMDGYYYIIYLNREGTTPVVGHINLVR
jgi:gliding motility-associated-like protein